MTIKPVASSTSSVERVFGGDFLARCDKSSRRSGRRFSHRRWDAAPARTKRCITKHRRAWHGICLTRLELRRSIMLWTLIMVLLVLWAVGLASAYTMGGLIHLLLVVAVIVLIFQLLSGRRTV